MKKRYWKMVNCGLYYPLSVFLLLSTFVTSCGGSSGNNLIPDPSLGQISKTEKMLFSASYDGSLVVNLGENAQLNHSKSIGDAEFYKSTPIYSVLDKYPSITASPLDDSAHTLAFGASGILLHCCSVVPQQCFRIGFESS